ncbi:hypothetical protein Goklo_029505 [Gossypium klotzschianum]|uniref:Uncharacterized protein n=1 Tax=Gossypium klotzschianum TaxID=34286 RepID=A0A7J8W5I8_9ROSI|nr:hypothetical protein [Gossypium klotzschianum]
MEMIKENKNPHQPTANSTRMNSRKQNMEL